MLERLGQAPVGLRHGSSAGGKQSCPTQHHNEQEPRSAVE
jgi:hypothetical protein